MEIIDIGLSDLEPISMDFGNSSKPTVNFGTGIELLMNDRKKSSSSSHSIDLGELDQLENELNELSGASSSNSKSVSYSSGSASSANNHSSSTSGETKTLSGFASNLFNMGSSFSNSFSNIGTTAGSNNTVGSNHNLGNDKNDSRLGEATVEGIGNSKTWDGFSKMNEVPLTGSAAPKMNDREKRRKKRAMIKKLEEWYEKGLIKNSSHFNMESAYDEVEDEYETALEDKRKKDSVKLQGWWFMTAINSIEYANSAFNPFDLNLDGWGEQVNEDIDSYEEIFSELHDKYKGGKLSPEISLLLRLGFSAAVVNITNKALSTATPGFNDIIKQSPELMKMFTSATVQSMGQQSPGFAMANNLANEKSVNTMFGAPPAPVETKNQGGVPRPGMNYTQHPGNRPDLAAGRGAMFREGGIDLSDSQERNRQTQAMSTQAQTQSMQSSFQPAMQQQQQQQPSGQRPEMRGPQNTDINNILSGLKTREVKPAENISFSLNDDNDSLLSISSLKDMQNGNMPKRTNRRKQKSDRNIVSLDI